MAADERPCTPCRPPVAPTSPVARTRRCGGLRAPLAVLLVEDDPDWAVLVERMLRSDPSQRCEVTHVETLAAAEAAAADGSFDCVLLDLSLPDVEEMEGVDRLLTADPAAAVVVLTGTLGRSLPVAALAHGAQDFLEKRHVAPEVLLATVRYAAERKLVEQALSERERFVSAVLDSLTSSAVVLDSSGRILHVNGAWRRFALTNGAPADWSGIGESYLRVCPPHVRDGLEGVLQGRAEIFEHDYECSSPTEERWFNMTATPLRDAGGDAGVVVLHVQITALKQAQRTLRSAGHARPADGAAEPAALPRGAAARAGARR